VTVPEFTLFHRVADPASARIRQRVVELGLKTRIDFQNADTDGKDELARLGGSLTPALWTEPRSSSASPPSRGSS